MQHDAAFDILHMTFMPLALHRLTTDLFGLRKFLIQYFAQYHPNLKFLVEIGGY